MAMPKTSTKQVGELQLTTLYFERAGDELPEHVHDERTNHLSVVSEGTFRCVGDPEIAGSVLTPGMVIDWPTGQRHGFVALVDGSRMIQIPKHPTQMENLK